LKTNNRQTVPDLLNNADDLAQQIDMLNILKEGKTRKQLTELVNRGQLDLNGATIDDYLNYIGQRRRRFAEDNAFREIIKADPGQAANSLFKKLLDPGNAQPMTNLREFLSVVRGNKQAENGLKASLVAELWRRSNISPRELVRETQDVTITAFDPALFSELVGNQRIRAMLQEVFPDNGELLDGLDRLAAVAFETSNFTKGSKAFAAALNPENAISQEAWSTLGRIMGLQVADKIQFINSLVAAGTGGRIVKNIGKSITGVKIKDILIEAALKPADAVELAKRTSESRGFWSTLLKAGIDTVPLGRPAAAAPVVRRAKEEIDEDEDTDRFEQIKPYVPPPEWPILRGDQSSARPTQPPSRRVASAPVGSPIGASILGQTNVLAPSPQGQAPTPQGRASAQTMAGLRDLGIPLFANKGGIVSLPCKPRQLVG